MESTSTVEEAGSVNQMCSTDVRFRTLEYMWNTLRIPCA